MSHPQPVVNPGRRAAAEALIATEAGAHVEDALGRLLDIGGRCEPGDRALAWNLALGVLRRRDALDAAIVLGAKRSMRTLDPGVRAILRCAVYELAFTRTPPHAAVDQAVALTRKLNLAHAAPFVNAVLRNAPAPDPELPGFPDVLVRRWRERWGARADAWMVACNQPAPLFLVPKEDEAGLMRSLQHAGIVALPVEGDGPSVFPRPLGIPPCLVTGLPGFEEGRFWVMDPAAVAVADLVAAGISEGSTVLDACAAPGGKSLRLASLGYRVTATDSSADRLVRMHENCERTGLHIETSVVDWTLPGAGDGTLYDAVLIDAPCSGLGTVRRHPDIRWRKTTPDLFAAHLKTLATRQAALLHQLKRRVKPGGILVYAVCSPEPEEGAAVARTLNWPVEATVDTTPGAADPGAGSDAHVAFRFRAPGTLEREP